MSNDDTAPVPEVDEIKARLIAKFPQVDGKTPPLYYMEIAEEYGQLARDLGRRLKDALLPENLASKRLAETGGYVQAMHELRARAEAAESKLASAVAAERERCAKIIEEYMYGSTDDWLKKYPNGCEPQDAIRGSERDGGGNG